MASNRIIPPGKEQLRPQAVTDAQTSAEELQQREERKVNRAMRAGSAAQIIIAIAAGLAICYVGKLVLVTLLVSVLITFMLAPVVVFLERIKIPRSLGAILAVLLLLAAAYGASYFFYNRAVSFAQELPKYSQRIQGMLSHVRQKTDQIEKTTQQVLPSNQAKGKKPLPVQVQNSSGSGLITEHIGA